MRILHVIPSLSLSRGGPSRAIRTMTEALAQTGNEVTIVTTNDDGPGTADVPLGRPVEECGVTVWYFPRQVRRYTVSWPLYRWLTQNITQYDVVHVHALFSFPSIAAARHAHRQHVPYVIRPLGTLNQWGMQHRRRLLKRLSFTVVERPILARAAAIHFTAEAERQEAAALGVLRGVVIPLGVDFSTLEHAQRPAPACLSRLDDPTTKILFLSRLNRKKGIHVLLDAFDLLRTRGRDVALIFAGPADEDMSRLVDERARRSDGRIVRTGFVDGAERAALFHAADIFVLPSFSENFGVAAVEALGAGLAVVLSEGVGVSSTVLAANAGLVVPPLAGPLADALGRLVDDPALRSGLADRARRLAHAEYSVDVTTARLIDMYRQSVGEAAHA